MLRSEKALDTQRSLDVLADGFFAVIATVSADGQPYAVPVNYVYSPQDHAVFLHSATQGRKLDNISQNPRVALTVVGEHTLVPQRFTTTYESVVAEGVASLVTDEDEKRRWLRALNEKYAPEFEHLFDEVIERSAHKTAVIRIDVASVVGKGNPAH